MQEKHPGCPQGLLQRYGKPAFARKNPRRVGPGKQRTL